MSRDFDLDSVVEGTLWGRPLIIKQLDKRPGVSNQAILGIQERLLLNRPLVLTVVPINNT